MKGTIRIYLCEFVAGLGLIAMFAAIGVGFSILDAIATLPHQ